jgi:hypothetical protein
MRIQARNGMAAIFPVLRRHGKNDEFFAVLSHGMQNQKNFLHSRENAEFARSRKMEEVCPSPCI